MSYSSDNILGIIIMILGSILLIQGLSYFLWPALLIGIGLFLVNYGLRLRRMPSLFALISRYWFFRMR